MSHHHKDHLKPPKHDKMAHTVKIAHPGMPHYHGEKHHDEHKEPHHKEKMKHERY